MNWKRYGIVTALLLATPALASAQSAVRVSAGIGSYWQGNDFAELKAGAEEIRVKRESTLGLGLNLELGNLRASLAYASDATLEEDGVEGRENIGTASVLAVSAGMYFRPIPRILFLQPYALVGAGLKRQNYSWDDDGIRDAFPEDESDFALHGGLGLDVNLGRLAVFAEATDYVSVGNDGPTQHDAFALIGLKFGIF